MYPMKMRPIFKDYLWGGDLLVTRYGKKTDMRPVAESWEISCYPESPSVVDNGGFAGQTLLSVLQGHPEMLGGANEFPVLIKLIDAKQALSVQVHPNDRYARENENQQGKNEMWYVMDCEENSELIVGFNDTLDKAGIERAIRENTLLDKAKKVKVRPGDCFMIPAGLMHAIGAGILIAEIQQSSDVTYRVYDYNRTGADGKPRPLHIKQAVDVIDSAIKAENRSHNKPEQIKGYTKTQLTDWKYFDASLISIDSAAEMFRDERSFDCLIVTEGSLDVRHAGESVLLNAGESVFIPAGLGEYVLKGTAKALLTTV